MNAILTDCEYLSSVCGRLRTDLSQMTGRPLPEASLAQWLECALLDCTADSTTANRAEAVTQVYLFHEVSAQQFSHFVPADFKAELDGKAFNGPVGEFLLAACPAQEELGSKETLICETLQSLLKADKTEHIILAVDLDAYGKRIKQLLADFPNAPVTLMSMSPAPSRVFRTLQIGFPLLAALGVRSDELQ